MAARKITCFSHQIQQSKGCSAKGLPVRYSIQVACGMFRWLFLLDFGLLAVDSSSAAGEQAASTHKFTRNSVARRVIVRLMQQNGAQLIL